MIMFVISCCTVIIALGSYAWGFLNGVKFTRKAMKAYERE